MIITSIIISIAEQCYVSNVIVYCIGIEKIERGKMCKSARNLEILKTQHYA